MCVGCVCVSCLFSVSFLRRVVQCRVVPVADRRTPSPRPTCAWTTPPSWSGCHSCSRSAWSPAPCTSPSSNVGVGRQGVPAVRLALPTVHVHVCVCVVCAAVPSDKHPPGGKDGPSLGCCLGGGSAPSAVFMSLHHCAARSAVPLCTVRAVAKKTNLSTVVRLCVCVSVSTTRHALTFARVRPAGHRQKPVQVPPRLLQGCEGKHEGVEEKGCQTKVTTEKKAFNVCMYVHFYVAAR